MISACRSHGSAPFGSSIPKPHQLLEQALRLRESFRDRVARLRDADLPTGGMARRWAIQDHRFTINRYLYLSSRQERERLLESVPECDELRPTLVVLQALISGDVSEIISYPGPTVSAFCQLWKESTEEIPRISWSSRPSKWVARGYWTLVRT